MVFRIELHVLIGRCAKERPSDGEVASAQFFGNNLESKRASDGGNSSVKELGKREFLVSVNGNLLGWCFRIGTSFFTHCKGRE